MDLLHAHGVNMRYLGELSEVHLECYSEQTISVFLYVIIAICCSYQYDEQIYIQQRILTTVLLQPSLPIIAHDSYFS